jgi:hypothetical protein
VEIGLAARPVDSRAGRSVTALLVRSLLSSRREDDNFMRKPLVGAVVAASLWVGRDASAAYTVNGNAADVAAFVGMMNGASVGGTWSATPGGALTFAATPGDQPNLFASTVSSYTTDASRPRTVFVGRAQPGVFCGSFNGNQTQTIDLDDLSRFNPSIATNRALDSRASILIHELAELYVDGGDPNFDVAHGSFGGGTGGVHDQNSEMTYSGGTGARISPGDIYGATLSADGTVTNYTWRFPFREVATGKTYYEVITGHILGGAANNVTIHAIRRGIADSGPDYDGSNLDVTIDSVTREEIGAAPAIPAWGMAVGALGLAVIGGAAYRARRPPRISP